MTSRPPFWHAVLAVAVGVLTVGVAVATQAGLYLYESLVAILRNEFGSNVVQAAVSVVAGAIVAAPAALLGRLPLAPGVRAALAVWGWAGVAAVGLGAARLAPADRHELYLLGLTAAALVVGLLHRRLTPKARDSPSPEAVEAPGAAAPLRAAAGVPRSALAAALGLVLLVPWVWIGALGGALESVLAVVAAAAIGWLLARILAPLLERWREGSAGVGTTLVRGLVLGVALATVAGATGEAGVGLAEACAVPAVGFTLAIMRRGTAVLAALAVLGPLAFVDPEETSLQLGFADVGYWTLVATGVTLAAAILVAAGLFGLTGRVRFTVRRPVAAAMVAVLALGSVAVYVTLGQPGPHGDRWFVVLREQADLDGLAAITDRSERLRQTYRRLVETAERSQAGLRRDLRRFRVDVTPYYLVNAVEVDGGPVVRAWLSRRSDVDRVLFSPVLRPLPAQKKPTAGTAERPDGPLWNIRDLNADKVWEAANVRGAGIVIGSSDSGIDGAHPAVSATFRGGDDSWYDPWNGTTRPTDNDGHGTHTLGSALGRDGIGVAPDATWMACVNLPRNLGNPARYLDCLQFMLAPFPRGGNAFRDGRPERAAHVLTNSWGCPIVEGCDGRALVPAVEALTAAGIFVVAGAGNLGPSCRTITDEPATTPAAFTVGAVTESGAVADFSGRGPVPGSGAAPGAGAGSGKPDAMAPGEDILSAAAGGGYRIESGTSMATPQVAGVVALMWAANPRLIGDTVRTADILRSTARTAQFPTVVTACGDERNVRGAGLVDALAAVTAARAMG